MTSAPVRSGIKEGKPDSDTSGRRPLNERLSAEFQSVKELVVKIKKGTNAFAYSTLSQTKTFFTSGVFTSPLAPAQVRGLTPVDITKDWCRVNQSGSSLDVPQLTTPADHNGPGLGMFSQQPVAA